MKTERVYHCDCDTARETKVPCGRHHQDEIDGLRERCKELEALLREVSGALPNWCANVQTRVMAVLNRGK